MISDLKNIINAFSAIFLIKEKNQTIVGLNFSKTELIHTIHANFTTTLGLNVGYQRLFKYF